MMITNKITQMLHQLDAWEQLVLNKNDCGFKILSSGWQQKFICFAIVDQEFDGMVVIRLQWYHFCSGYF